MSGRPTRRGIGSWLALHALGAVLFWFAAAALLSRAHESTPRLDALSATLAEDAPDVVLLGNSMLADGVHVDLLNELLRGAGSDLTVAAHAVGGTYTAYWNLVLRNFVLAAERPPRLVVIPFRDPMLLHGTYGTTGDGAQLLAAASPHLEPFVHGAFALGEEMSWLDAIRLTYGDGSLIDALRGMFRERVLDVAKTLPARALGLDYASAASGVLPRRADVGAAVPTTGLADFDDDDLSLWRSLLPLMVGMCREVGVDLAFLRFKKGFERDWSDALDPELLADATARVDDFLARVDVPLLDGRADAHLHPGMFRGEDHLNEAGRELFTVRLAHWLLRWERVVATVEHPDERRVALEASFAGVLAAEPDALVEERPVFHRLDAADFEPVRGRMFRVALPEPIASEGDTALAPKRSRWELLEDGRRVGPAHSPAAAIVRLGGGRYAHRDGALFFSSSDGTSPLENGRRYTLRLRRLRLRPPEG